MWMMEKKEMLLSKCIHQATRKLRRWQVTLRRTEMNGATIQQMLPNGESVTRVTRKLGHVQLQTPIPLRRIFEIRITITYERVIRRLLRIPKC